tara:strand:+ start:261 stop:1493 length:1233 start_codon:yes stop_codon:yes gene_type:complete
MTPENWLLIIICLVLFNYFFSTILEYINDKNWKTDIPKNMNAFYAKEKYEKARKYSIEKGKISFISSTFSLILVLLLLWFEGYGFIDSFISTKYDGLFIQSGLFFLVLMILNDLIKLPFEYYFTFIIEEKYGFNKTTIRTFFIDKIKKYILSILIGGGILAGTIYLFSYVNNSFWLWLWTGMSIFLILTNMFYAELIVPIFNKLKPLNNGSLKNKIEAYSKKVGYSLSKIYVIDGSKRSSKANAFFSGLGSRKTIALYDTLIEKHSEDELVAVLAHEVGHYKKKHILTSLILSILQLGLMCFLFELCLNEENISKALGSDKVVFHLGLVGFGILYSPIGTIVGIFMNILSRKNEFEADEYAKKTFEGSSLELALKKLSVDNLTNLYPHPLYVFIHYSHPPLLKRLEALSK